MSEDMSAESSVIKAWYMAVGNQLTKQDLIFHSDKGFQYVWTKCRNILKSYEILEQSMSRKGNCWGNGMAESFFKNLKTEWVYNKTYQLKTDAEISIFKWIELGVIQIEGTQL